MRCLSCHQENPAEARTCTSCAAPIAQAGERSPRSAHPERAPISEASAAGPHSFGGGRYQTERLLGKGSRKLVYLARDSELDCEVAVAVVKVKGLEPEGLSRARREARAMGRLRDHPNIVTVFDVGEEDSQPYIVSERMPGGDLGQRLDGAEGRRLPLQEALRIAQQVCRALEHAHARGIVHRDLKPENIWLTEDGVAKLGDFGLAADLDASGLGAAGAFVGTVLYMPPEQALGHKIDARSDLYSLGCVLYEMVAGWPPFRGDDAVTVISQHLSTRPVAPASHNPDVPPPLDRLILKLLAKSPDDRPDSAAAVLRELEAISAAPASPAAVVEIANPLDRLADGVFVGRERETRELLARLDGARSGRGCLVLIDGEPGIGKTRTVEHLATYALLRNARVHWGRCHEGEGAPAYWPWVQVIRSCVRDDEAGEVVLAMGSGAADIAQIVPEVRERVPNLPAAPSLEGEESRFRLFDSVATFLRNASDAQPMVLVLEDLHWADAPSVLLLKFLARELPGTRLLILGTFRDVELSRDDPLWPALGELAAGLRLHLDGLSEDDTARFVALTASVDLPEAVVESVHLETGGNPLFLNEIVRLLMNEGRLERAQQTTPAGAAIPQTVRQVIRRRADRLTEECRAVLTVASVVGREFPLQVLEAVGDVPAGRLLEVIEEAERARVISRSPDRAGWFSFSHALVRETLYNDLSAPARLRYHARTGEALEGLHAANPEPNLAELAHHFLEAARGGDHVDRAFDYACRAGERAARVLAYEEAARQYRRALDALKLAGAADSEQRCGVLLALGDALWKAGDIAAAKAAFEEAAGLARSAGANRELARAALGFAGPWGDFGRDDPDVAALLEEASNALGDEDSPLRARVLARLGVELFYVDSTDRREALSGAAVEVARRVGDPATLAYVLGSRHLSLWQPDNVTDRLATAEEMVRLSEEAGDKERSMQARAYRVIDLMQLGDMAAAEREVQEAAELAEELREPRYLWNVAIFRGGRALLSGRWEEAERLAHEALAIGQRGQNPDAFPFFGVQMFALYREQGRLAELEPGMRANVEQFPAIPSYRCGLALLYTELGRLEEARAQFEHMAADNFASLPRDGSWLVGMVLLAEACADLADVPRAAHLYELLLPFNDEMTVVAAASVCLGPNSYALGRLAATLSRWPEAEAHFKQALEVNARIGAAPGAAHTQHQYAKMLLARGRPGDREEALERLDHALAAAQRLEMKSLAEKALALKLRIKGVEYGDVRSSIDAVASSVTLERPDVSSRAAPDGTVTIVFTDIEGSAAMTERLGDRAWMELLREHNAIVRRELAAHGGLEVKSQGDGFMLAFPSARSAVQCAIGIQRSFAGRNAHADEPIRVRMGIHTGEAIREAGDFYGKTVVLAARIASDALADEILVSSSVRELTAGDSGMEFGRERQVELKGLSGPHRVIDVKW